MQIKPRSVNQMPLISVFRCFLCYLRDRYKVITTMSALTADEYHTENISLWYSFLPSFMGKSERFLFFFFFRDPSPSFLIGLPSSSSISSCVSHVADMRGGFSSESSGWWGQGGKGHEDILCCLVGSPPENSTVCISRSVCELCPPSPIRPWSLRQTFSNVAAAANYWILGDQSSPLTDSVFHESLFLGEWQSFCPGASLPSPVNQLL